MKLSILLILLSSHHFLNQRNRAIIIHPNSGIDDITLLKSKPKDVLLFKGAAYEKTTYRTARCGNVVGVKAKLTTYHNDSLGLQFGFYQRVKSGIFPIWTKPKLVHIRISKAITLSDGLKVGLSTKEDVLKVYGPLPKDWDSEGFIIFHEKGIGFEFNENTVLNGVKIFPVKWDSKGCTACEFRWAGGF